LKSNSKSQGEKDYESKSWQETLFIHKSRACSGQTRGEEDRQESHEQEEEIIMAKKDARISRAGVSGYNKPKRTPKHATKSHVVVAKDGDQVKTIRFGQQGKTGDKTMTKRAKSFKARHAKNIAKGKMSAAYWANKVKW